MKQEVREGHTDYPPPHPPINQKCLPYLTTQANIYYTVSTQVRAITMGWICWGTYSRKYWENACLNLWVLNTFFYKKCNFKTSPSKTTCISNSQRYIYNPCLLLLFLSLNNNNFSKMIFGMVSLHSQPFIYLNFTFMAFGRFPYSKWLTEVRSASQRVY